MDATLKKSVKLVSELLKAKSYKHFDKKTGECDDICIKKNQVIFAFENDFIEFYECSKILDFNTLKYIHDIIKVYLKALNALKNSNCLSPVTTHEIKGMLATAKLSVEMLTKYDFDKEDRDKLLSQSYESITKTVDIFEEMLQIERLQHQNDENKIEITEFDISEIINKNLNTLILSTKSKNLKIYFNKEKKQIIKGSYFWLDRAIFNLLNNAIKYNIENGYLKIDIST
ncbi:MAG: HAMP domain-containing histidine kinase, partial [Epsilonproteobacteria bacterium]|nr:HAMP domain-containing histidine kinase [Campylobacterota bacterium]